MKLSAVKLLIVIALFALPSFVFAQTTKQIQFAKGKNSAVIKSTTGKDGTTYAFKAKAGQKLTLNLVPTSNIGIKVETNGADGENVLLKEEKGGYYEIELEDGGDYTIFLGSINHKSAAFTLTVKISN